MIITIAHTKGGVGKSTLAWHLAHSYKEQRVTIIDLDFQQTLKFVSLLGGNFSLDLLQPKNPTDLLITLGNIPKWQIVIIDVGGFDNDINRLAIKHSDKVVIPISDSVTEVLGLKTFESIIKEIDTQADISVVLNNVHPLSKNFQTIIKTVGNAGFYMCDAIIRSRKVYKSSMGYGINIFQDIYKKKELYIKAREDIERLRDELR